MFSREGPFIGPATLAARWLASWSDSFCRGLANGDRGKRYVPECAGRRAATDALGHNVVRERMNARRRPITAELIKRLEFAQMSLGGIQVFLTAMLLVACPFLSGVALAQDSKGVEGASAASAVHGVVTHVDLQGQSTALASIPVKLSDSRRAQPLSTLTDAEGRFEFPQLDAGDYLLEVNLPEFQPFTRKVVLHERETRVEDIGLELETVSQSVEVQAQASEVAAHSADPDATLGDREFPALPMAQQTAREALPLVPGVVRTMDGKLNIKGEVEGQGMLLVDSAQLVDPVTGSFATAIPLAAVETLNVYETPYNAQYGGFSGGLATIETKAPPGQWQYSVMDFVPGLRMKNRQISGVSAETPRLFAGGPLLKDKLNISEAFDYVVKNSPVRGLPWPVDEVKTRGFTSFTTLQAILSPKHLLTANVAAFSMRTQFADINALVPQSASSNSGSKGVSASLSDSYQLEAGTLATTFRYTRFDSNAYGQGSEDMLVTPGGWGGNFFNSWNRTANQFEGLPTFQLTRKNWHGSHDLKVGVDVLHQSYTGSNQSRPIEVLREDGSLAEQINFQGPNRLNGEDTEVSEFAQDHWVLTDRLAVDSGLRLSTQSNGRSAALAPRTGLTYSLDRANKTVLHVGAGIFYDRVPLLATSFSQNPTRVDSFYNEAGLIIGAPVPFQNAYLETKGGQMVIGDSRDPGTSPRNATWNVGVDRQLRSGLTLRLNYLQSQTSDLFVVNPETTGENSLLALTHTGNSHYREFQASVHYRPSQRIELNSAYIHSRSKGDLNTLSDTFVPFEQPVIRPNTNGYLASDIPDRLLSSGVLQLPWNLTVSPVVDLHTGYRYSDVDVLQNYVGTPNSQRFPTFFSLNLKVYKDFQLPAFVGRIRDHRLRIGVYSMNLTNHWNPHDVLNNIASPDFGHFVGFQHRVNGLLIDIIK